MPDDEDHAVADQLVCGGDRLIRVAEVVAHDELDLLAEDAFVSVVTGERLYPGRPVYLMIDGQRFTGEEHIPVAALKGGQEAHVEWSSWPSGGREERVMDLDGFGAAYDECVAELERLGYTDQLEVEPLLDRFE